MLEYLRLRWRLRRLESEHRRWEDEQERRFEEAVRKSGADKTGIREHSFREERLFNEDVSVLHTTYLFRQARRMMISMDQWIAPEYWEEGQKGWVPSIGAITGLVGATTALVALLLRGMGK
jgi:hypothetical protein